MPAPPPPPAAPPRTRIGGVDAARAVAVIGMATVHFGPSDVDPGLLAWVYRLPYGRASALFVLLAGIGVSLLAGARSAEPSAVRPAEPSAVRPAEPSAVRPAERRGRTVAQLAWRAAVFLPLGVALQELDTGVAVILHYYAAYYLLGAAALWLSDRALLVTTAVCAVAGPVCYLALAIAAGGAGFRTIPDPTDVGGIARALLVDGYYPLLTWGPWVLLGMWVGRRNLRSPRTAWILVAAGSVAAAVAYAASELLRARFGEPGPDPSWNWLTLAEGHRGMPLTAIAGAGVACAVLGLLLRLVDRLPRVSWPLVAAGQLALTIYVGHLLVLATVPQLLVAREAATAATGKVLRFAAVAIALATLWRLMLARGPLEQLLALPFTRRAGSTRAAR